jgi:hypothetical protein
MLNVIFHLLEKGLFFLSRYVIISGNCKVLVLTAKMCCCVCTHIEVVCHVQVIFQTQCKFYIHRDPVVEAADLIQDNLRELTGGQVTKIYFRRLHTDTTLTNKLRI